MTSPFYVDATVTVHHGDCLDVLRGLPDDSIDAVVTDPPYGLGFMGKEWDKPGRAARATTTAIDHDEHNPFKQGRVEYGGSSYGKGYLEATRGFQNWCEAWSSECLRVLKPGGHMLAFGGTRTWHRLASAVEDAGFELRDSIAWLYGSGFPKSLNLLDEQGDRTGWGTALKPAFEPIVVARKPIVGTVAANVLAHGTGALNVDGCRIPVGDASYARNQSGDRGHSGTRSIENARDTSIRTGGGSAADGGRWPANVVLDESQAAELDAQSGELTSGANPTRRGSDKFRDAYGEFAGQEDCVAHRGVDVGGASRFFYTAKAGADERVRINGIAHPTVKPLSLMRWLVRLITPLGGTVLDLFAGSGTTVEACILEGLQCIASEQEVDYLPLIRQRIERRRDPVAAVLSANADGDDQGLFGLLNGEGT